MFPSRRLVNPPASDHVHGDPGPPNSGRFMSVDLLDTNRLSAWRRVHPSQSHSVTSSNSLSPGDTITRSPSPVLIPPLVTPCTTLPCTRCFYPHCTGLHKRTWTSSLRSQANWPPSAKDFSFRDMWTKLDRFHHSYRTPESERLCPHDGAEKSDSCRVCRARGEKSTKVGTIGPTYTIALVLQNLTFEYSQPSVNYSCQRHGLTCETLFDLSTPTQLLIKRSCLVDPRKKSSRFPFTIGHHSDRLVSSAPSTPQNKVLNSPISPVSIDDSILSSENSILHIESDADGTITIAVTDMPTITYSPKSIEAMKYKENEEDLQEAGQDTEQINHRTHLMDFPTAHLNTRSFNNTVVSR